MNVSSKQTRIYTSAVSYTHLDVYKRQVRARTIESLIDANKKVNRALMAGAMAVGAEIEIKEIPGYLPILRHDSMEKVLRENINFIGIKDDEIIEGGDFTGSFDFGDVSHIIPTLHPM